ncbi:MAG: MerR family transcriptional regulator [Lachnospiraceae bacterium]|nr:MerR family transcriptional regulator [Lachnospiraceae bacterium]
MKDMTLREVCNIAKVTRRAVQGYEKAGLVSATGKNERGYLLYDVNSQERIKQIKLFQRLGFSIREITYIIDAPNNILKSALEEKVKKLREKRENMEMLIDKANELIEKL